MVFWWHPCGLICLLFTYGMVFYADYVVVFQLVQPVLKTSVSAIFSVIGFNTIVLLLTVSHLCAVFTDPGLIPLDRHPVAPNDYQQKRPAGWESCKKCSIFRPPRSYHCRMCKRCVLRMDHHCPWINNCVGECNQKFFIQFLFYVGLLCLYSLFMIIVCRAVFVVDNDATRGSLATNDNNIRLPPVTRSQSERQGESTQRPYQVQVGAMAVAHTIILLMISLVFGLFIIAIFSDQYKSIVEDQTAVEAVKFRNRPVGDIEQGGGSYHELTSSPGGQTKLSRLRLFQSVFGPGPMILWLLPFTYIFKSTRPSFHESDWDQLAITTTTTTIDTPGVAVLAPTSSTYSLQQQQNTSAQLPPSSPSISFVDSSDSTPTQLVAYSDDESDEEDRQSSSDLTFSPDEDEQPLPASSLQPSPPLPALIGSSTKPPYDRGGGGGGGCFGLLSNLHQSTTPIDFWNDPTLDEDLLPQLVESSSTKTPSLRERSSRATVGAKRHRRCRELDNYPSSLPSSIEDCIPDEPDRRQPTFRCDGCIPASRLNPNSSSISPTSHHSTTASSGVYPRLTHLWPWLALYDSASQDRHSHQQVTLINLASDKRLTPTFLPINSDQRPGSGGGGGLVWAKLINSLSSSYSLLTASPSSIGHWSLETGQCLTRTPTKTTNSLGNLRCASTPTASSTTNNSSIHRPVVIAADQFGQIGVWDLRCSPVKPQSLIKHPVGGGGTLQRVAISDLLCLSDHLFVSSSDSVQRDQCDLNLAVWDLRLGRPISHQLFQERWGCSRLALHPSSSYNRFRFAVQTHGDYVFEVNSRLKGGHSSDRPKFQMEKKWRYEGHECQAHPLGLNYSPDGRWLASCSMTTTSSSLKSLFVWSSSPHKDPGNLLIQEKLVTSSEDVPIVSIGTSDVAWLTSGDSYYQEWRNQRLAVSTLDGDLLFFTMQTSL